MMTNKFKSIYFEIEKKNPKFALYLKRLLKFKKLMNNTNIKIKGRLNRFEYPQAILNNVSIDIVGDRNKLIIKKGTVLNNIHFFIRGNDHKIIIGENCTFARKGLIWFEHDNGSLVIGSNTTMEDVTIAVTEPNSSISIGEDCMFANDIDIRTGDSHSIIDKVSGKRLNYAKDVIIGKHVWVAAHCRILKGACIQDDSVIGTNSVVTKHFNESGVVLAGSPAKTVKRNISWDRENIL